MGVRLRRPRACGSAGLGHAASPASVAIDPQPTLGRADWLLVRKMNGKPDRHSPSSIRQNAFRSSGTRSIFSSLCRSPFEPGDLTVERRQDFLPLRIAWRDGDQRGKDLASFTQRDQGFCSIVKLFVYRANKL